MKLKLLLISCLLSLCAQANAEWFLRGAHNSWVATQMLSAGAGTNTMQLDAVVFASAGNIKFDRFGDWTESYGVGGLNGSNIAVAAGTWDIKFFTNSKTWSITATPTAVSYHVRGTHNSWAEGTLMTRVSNTNVYESCINFVSGDANGGPRFKIDPNGSWGDAVPAADFVVSAGWVKISFNSSTQVISTQQNLAANCALSSSSQASSTISSTPSSVASSSLATSSAVSSAVTSSAPASIYHVRGTFNSWAEGTLMTRVGTSNNYEYCANFTGSNPRFKIDPNGGWGSDAVPTADFLVSVGWVKINFNSSNSAISVQQNLAANCASTSSTSSVITSSAASSIAASIYHVRGTFNNWAEGTLMSRIGTTDNYEKCINFITGDANGGPRFKIDPNGGWGSDALPTADVAVTAGWVKISFNSISKAISAQQNQPYNCGDPSSKVFFQVDKGVGHILLFVNGIERMRWTSAVTNVGRDDATSRTITDIRFGQAIDITHLMGQGENEIKIVGTADSWGGMVIDLSTKLWTDNNAPVIDTANSSPGGETPAVLINRKVTVNIPNAPARRTLTINATGDDEAIYINNVYTGKKAPAVFQLSPGEYRLGIGKSTSVLLPNRESIFTGQFYEKDIVIADQNITHSSASIPLLTQVNNEINIGVVPLREMHYGLTLEQAVAGQSATVDKIGLMTNDDIVVAEKGFNVISTNYVLPFSYGLTKWKVTMLPVVEGRSYESGSYHESGIHFGVNGDRFQFGNDTHQYDIIVYLMPTQQANRQHVGVGVGGGVNLFFGAFPSDWATGGTEGSLAQRLAAVKPDSGLIHEMLHYADNRRWNDAAGADQIHGAEEHGYKPADCVDDWVCWYRDYSRSQVGEDTSTLVYVDWSQTAKVAAISKIAPEAAAHFTGTFNVMHSGPGAAQLWSYSKPATQIQNIASSTCLGVNLASHADNSPIIGAACNSAALNQSWSLKHVQNGPYHVVAEHSRKCAEFSQGQLLQNTCGLKAEQRFVITEPVAGNFYIKSLAGQCLALTASGAALQTCNAVSTQQQWRFTP